ncbi:MULTISPECIES: hypothetical protein [unclassified Cryobacterium]|uniref:hypothetical protein n=1 Tax=unclassified Cryobacterium TaxID=2649013 RepID=UPI0018CA730C|nr:hypothetical protein [Cryobacterium sp. CAN_C3]
MEIEVHPYALIGRQVSSWVSGYLWAKDLDFECAGGALTKDPEGLFDFSRVTSRPPESGVKRVWLTPVGDQSDPRVARILRAQVASVKAKFPDLVLMFRSSLDPGLWGQVPTEGAVRGALQAGSPGEKFDRQEAQAEYVASHVRRGADIHENHMGGAGGINRWVLEDWHVEVVKALRATDGFDDMEIQVYALEQPKDFPLLALAGVLVKLNGDRDTDLIEFASARLLVLSSSSFSFTAALASRNVILGRVPWWHKVPDTGRWVNIDAKGNFSTTQLSAAIAGGV